MPEQFVFRRYLSEMGNNRLLIEKENAKKLIVGKSLWKSGTTVYDATL